MPPRPLITDEPPDRYLFRPLAAALVKVLVHTPLTPNQVSVAAALSGIASGVALALGRPVAFAVLLVGMAVLDCADGQLARLRGGGDVWGRIVDGLADYSTAISLHIGLMVVLAPVWGTGPAVAWCVAAGLSMAWGSYLLDKYKRRYRGDVDDLEAIRAYRDASRGLKRFFVARFLLYASGMTQGPGIPDREAYRARTRPAMALWLWMGPTMHYVLVIVLVLVGRTPYYPLATVVVWTPLTVLVLLFQRRLQSRPPAVVVAVERVGANATSA